MYVCMYVWQALDASKVGQNSLWADENDADIMLDEDEFNKLFVDRSFPHTYIHTYIQLHNTQTHAHTHTYVHTYIC